ncbi:hypothetical protein K505DRAFT_349588 [Melanomma pulvis-pyrius CBS 109.77]|uniref:AAA+ ATPase lid domain-containing protein n=1 Tax=Melanomma pulvis-pyrius CBS 109.77 TaxID=1314802 RepID=A0A6A6XCK3_9PLEO|nr:hypothetical protein K505DRAFT_349588 [Melanomma pulvis-pyrius CBS 109.77]
MEYEAASSLAAVSKFVADLLETDLIVDLICEVAWDKEVFKHLVADNQTKEFTFTAESVVEMAEKPLYLVTCGAISTEPEQVEKYLESVLHMGKIWDCVVGAAVFLEERSMADLTHNALVYVFLRVLECYDGILILISNRSQRCRIWKVFIARLKSLEEPDIDFDDIECSVMELANEELNGRQIRNAITIGRQLARFQGKSLLYQRLSHVIKVAGLFKTYVKNTKEGLSDDQIARAS